MLKRSRRTPATTAGITTSPFAGMTWPGALLWLLAALCLGACFATGGSSQQTGYGVLLGQLLSLAILLVLPMQDNWQNIWTHQRWAWITAGLIVLLPALQLLPLPAQLWQFGDFRAALQQDLAAVGINEIRYRGSLTPTATERDLYLLLPPLALFCAASCLERRQLNALSWVFVFLVACSVLLAFMQMATGQHGIFNPYPQHAPAMGGVFANPNHQACALAMALVVTLSHLLRRIQERRMATPGFGLSLAMTLLLGAVVPITGSRAGVLITLAGCAGVVLLMGTASAGSGDRKNRGAQWAAGLGVLLLVAAAWGGISWVQHDASLGKPGSRWSLLVHTARDGMAQAPLGSGFGAYVRAFEQATQGKLMSHAYINAAHNDYLQWWFEGGPLAIAVMLLAAFMLLFWLYRLLPLRSDSRQRFMGITAWLAVSMPLLHSFVDYPLRTPALMAAFGLMAGICLSCSQAPTRPDLPIANRSKPHSPGRETMPESSANESMMSTRNQVPT